MEVAALKNFFTSHKDTSYIRGYRECQKDIASEIM